MAVRPLAPGVGAPPREVVDQLREFSMRRVAHGVFRGELLRGVERGALVDIEGWERAMYHRDFAAEQNNYDSLIAAYLADPRCPRFGQHRCRENSVTLL